jgi:hypothetical protein
MQQKTITVLPLDEIRILKQIIIINDSQDNREISIGYILYERKMSQDYKFIETPKEERDFTYYLDYPKQDSYPNDNVDDILLQSVRNRYPKSKLINHSIICNVDLEKINMLQNPPSELSQIQITPDFSGIDISTLVGKQFEQAFKQIKIYADFRLEDIKNLAFFGYYDLNDDEIINKVREVRFV